MIKSIIIIVVSAAVGVTGALFFAARNPSSKLLSKFAKKGAA
ncbi:hypothetical protein [Geminisphaera colitermitum]|nr:hypothetical protein [Geminisphaera colitermitum]